MSFASLIFSNWHWLEFVAGAGVIALLLSFWSYRAGPAGIIRWVCLALRALGLAVLGFCLLEPLWSGQRVRPGSNLFAIVVDNSQGLQIKDRGQPRTRGESLRALLNPQIGGWQEALEENFEVRRYVFDSRLEASKSFDELTFEGRATALGSALKTLAERYQNRPLAGVLLLTDGNATDIRGSLPELPGLPPVYPVVIGSREPINDIAIQQAHVNQTDFEDAPVSVQADVTAAGYRGEAVVAELLDRSGKKVSEQTLRARGDGETIAFRFQLKPETSGLSFYRLQVRAKNELDQPQNAPAASAEATLANNNTVLVVDRGHGPYRILYVSGRPNWEFKFLNRALQADDQVQLVAMIRVAKREPKFDFLGRPGETSNPLFRGFGNQSREESQRYDQPVLIRLNTRDEFELRGGFPSIPEDLYDYHAIVVDDLESEFFSVEQQALVQKFVSERGGGFLMLGGSDSFQQGHYQRTPIGDMLPVYLDHLDESKAPGSLRANLTREGFLQPWARLRDNEKDELARLQGMELFPDLNRVREIKPGASVVATVSDENGKLYPAIAVQRFGRGRTAALMLAGLWHWGFQDEAAHHDLDKAWRQMMRWLVTDVPNRVELTAEPQAGDANGGMALQVRVRDPKFQPLDNAGVTLDIQPVLGATLGAATNSIRLQAEPSVKEAGLYEAMYIPRVTGGYKVTAYVTNSLGLEVGRSETGWSTDLAAEEFRSLTPNISLLETIAHKTGGEMIPAGKLEEFARKLPHRQAPVMEAWTYPFWHTPAILAIALACFAAEWGLRRWKGMP